MTGWMYVRTPTTSRGQAQMHSMRALVEDYMLQNKGWDLDAAGLADRICDENGIHTWYHWVKAEIEEQGGEA